MSTPIKFEDIRVGDTIKVINDELGVFKERTGKVARKEPYGLSTVEGGVLFHIKSAGKYTFDLIDRPKPSLPTELGSLILAEMPTETVQLVLRRDDIWDYLNGESFYSAYAVSQRPWRLLKLVDA